MRNSAAWATCWGEPGRLSNVAATAPADLRLRGVVGHHHRAGEDAIRPHPRVPPRNSTASMRVIVGSEPLLM